METRANKNSMKFNKDTYKVLQLGKNNSNHQPRLGYEKQRCRSDGNALGIMEVSNLDMSQQCVPGSKEGKLYP